MQILFIAVIPVTTFFYRNQGGDFWINVGYKVMEYKLIPMLFFFVCALVSIFSNNKTFYRLTILVLSIIGIVVYFNAYLYPF